MFIIHLFAKVYEISTKNTFEYKIYTICLTFWRIV